SGSVIARPDDGIFRSGRQRHLEAQQVEKAGNRVFTMVDTITNQIYYFCATNPPTVCVYVGREGGLGRYILCSEHCGQNELHKEAVLRMPTHISDCMCQTDWLAIGGVASNAGYHRLSICPAPPRTTIGHFIRSIASVVAFVKVIKAAPTSTSFAMTKRWTLPSINLPVSLDPISLITLFLDSPEK